MATYKRKNNAVYKIEEGGTAKIEHDGDKYIHVGETSDDTSGYDFAEILSEEYEAVVSNVVACAVDFVGGIPRKPGGGS